MKLDKQLDRESKSGYSLDIVLYHSDNTADMSTRLNIVVTDVNDNEPKFDQIEYKFELVENNSPNISLGRVQAFDHDLNENGTVEYFLPDNGLSSFNSSGTAETGIKISCSYKDAQNRGKFSIDKSQYN